jgi:hypothetical protein
MLTNRLGILGAIVILPAFAQVSSAPAKTDAAQQISPRFHAPMHGRLESGDGTTTSTNWSGYAVTGTSFTEAAGSWIVPAVTCNSGDQYAVFWVGIDGYASSTVEQTGTEATCVGTTAQYSAWYEFCCSEPIITIPSITVTPGDLMRANVTYNSGTGEFTVTIKDVTNGESYSTSKAVPNAQRSSAEWIAEAPSSFIILPLADYGTVLFGRDPTTLPDTNRASDSTTSGFIGVFSTIEQITMEKKGVMESIPSGLSIDGTSFSVTWAAQ